MSGLIKVPLDALAHIDFEFVELFLENTNAEQYDVLAGVAPEGEVYTEPHYSRSAFGRAVFSAEFESKALKLSFDWTADASSINSYKNSFNFEVGFAVEPNAELNFCLVDDDGEVVDLSLDDIEREAAGFEDFREKAKLLLPTCEKAEELIETGVSDMKSEDIEEYLIERDNTVDLKFKGKVLGFASSRDAYQDGGRWFELTLYQTVGGKYICQKEDVTCWQGERNRYFAEVVETLDEVKEFFGNGWVSKELYAEAGIENVIEVD